MTGVVLLDYAHWFEGVETGAVDEIGAMIGAPATTATASMQQ